LEERHETDDWQNSSVETLVVAAQGRNAEAFAELIRRYEAIALSIAYAQTRNAADAGDVVQEAFLRAWQRLDTLEDPARFSHWLGRMIRNLAIDQKRRKRPVRLDSDVDVPSISHATAGLEAAEQKRQLDHALSTLDELSRSCVVLRYYDNLSSKEIGELLDLSPAAVDMRISRARTHLREKLGTIAQDLA
jgi:RNA polymerase sigma-70 factor (ECF subfamily)